MPKQPKTTLINTKTGGGIRSGNVKQSYNPKSEPAAKAQSVEAVAQQGMSLAFKHKNLESGPGYTPKAQSDSGSRSYYNSPKAGPGSLRTIHPAGTQSKTPSASPLPKGRPVF
jgi:hypothetical protein